MKKYAVIKLIAYTFAALVLTGVLVFGIISESLTDMFSFIESDGDSIKTDGSEITLSNDINELDIKWVSGNVTITISDDDKIHFVESAADGLSDKETLTYKISDDELEINYCKQSVFGANDGVPTKDLTVKLPEKQYKQILVDAVSAKINIKNISADEFDCETVSGDADIYNCSFLSSEIETVSGNTEMYLPADATFTAEFDSVSGKFETDFEITKQAGFYSCGDGQMKISADSVSGNLRIHKQ